MKKYKSKLKESIEVLTQNKSNKSIEFSEKHLAFESALKKYLNIHYTSEKSKDGYIYKFKSELDYELANVVLQNTI